ncbi:MAG: Hsp20/alpha crystallin family protein [Candidatus Binatia bacterium]|nr:Hsp20/alpha crystallin family protein [Candidatus Binatia bacterium]
MAQLLSISEQIDRLFDELVHRRWGTKTGLTPAQVKTLEDGWQIEIPVPGLKAEEIDVHVAGRELWIRGVSSRQSEHRAGVGSWARMSRNVSLTRYFLLPQTVDPADVDARLEDGVLKIHIRRREGR